MKVAIIGSGLSGLTAAALLVKEGHDVVVYEQHEKIGGVTSTLEIGGYRWDWGQMIVPDLGPGEPGWNVFDRLGIADKIKTVPGYRENFFPDFRISRARDFPGRSWRQNYLKTVFPEDAAGLDRYYRLYERIHDLVALNNRGDILSKIKLFFKFLPLIQKKNWSAQRLMDGFFSNTKLHAIFNAILADYVISPDDFPGLLLPIINAESQYDERVPLDYNGHEHRSSWRFVVNGCIELIRALANAVTSRGGAIITSMAVKKIKTENKKVRAIELADGGVVPIDAVVASGGARELFLGLVGKDNIPQDFIRDHVDNISVTDSVFMIHLGVDYDPSVHQNGASLCYYYLTYDIRGSIEKIMNGIYHEGREGFLIYIPSKHSPGMAPAGHHAVTVFTIAPNKPVQGSWSEMKEQWADMLLELAERHVPGLREHAKVKIILTPDDFKIRSHLEFHAFGGSVPRLDRTPPTHKTPIEGLWFVGAQSENFGGVTGAITGASNAVTMMLKMNEAGKGTGLYKGIAKQ